MSQIFDPEMELPIPCPECGNEIEMAITEMERKPTVECPACGETVTVDLDELKGTLDNMEDEWINFMDEFE